MVKILLIPRQQPNPSFEGTAPQAALVGSLRASRSGGPSTQTLGITEASDGMARTLVFCLSIGRAI